MPKRVRNKSSDYFKSDYNLRSKSKRIKRDKNSDTNDYQLFETQNCEYLSPITVSAVSQSVTKTVTKMPNRYYYLRQRPTTNGITSGRQIRQEISSTTINDLPDDCLLLIFDRLETILDKCRIQSVSRRFNHLISRLLIAQKVFTVDATFGYNPKQNQVLTKQMCNSVIQKCPNLQRFKMPGFYTRDSNSGSNNTKVGDKEMQTLASKCQDLRELDICGCGRVSETGIAFIIAKCSKLEKLSLSFCHSVSTVSLQHLKPNFRTLSLNLNDSTPDLIKILQNLSKGEGRHLKELNVCTYSSVESQEDILEMITTFQELEVLRYSIVSKIHCKYNLLGKLSNLKHLAFDCNSFSIDDSTLIQILRGCGHRLKTLFIRYEVKKSQNTFTDNSLKRIPYLCPNVEKIHLHSKVGAISTITEETINSLATLQNLEHLDLKGLPNINDSVINVIRQCSRLKNLFLIDCQNVTNATFNAFVESAKQKTNKKFRFSFSGTNVRIRRKKLPSNLIDCSDRL